MSFGNASGAVTGVDLGILSAKGSLYVTRPTLATYTATPDMLRAAAAELFDLVAKGAITPDITRHYKLACRRRKHIATLTDAMDGTPYRPPGRRWCRADGRHVVTFTWRRAGRRHHRLDPEGAQRFAGAVKGSIFSLLALFISADVLLHELRERML